MILFRVFFDFRVEVLEGFKAWFLQSFCTSESLHPSNVLGRLLFIRVLRWVSDTWQSLIGDTCHSLIGPPMSSLTRARPLVSSLTRARLLCHRLHTLRCLCHRLHVLRCDWFLHDTWQISVGFWIVIAKPSSNMWCFVIGCILWTW